MIPSNKQGLWSWILGRYVGLKVRRTFRALWVIGQRPRVTQGTIFYANHSSFWDGFIAYEFARAAGWEVHCLMEEQQLHRFRFLTRIGAFSIRRHDPRSALETLRYAKRLLARGTSVLIFPEGELHNRAELLPLERGIEVLASAAAAPCVPVAFRYAFLEHELPDVLIAVGEPHGPAPLATFAQRLTDLHRSLSRAESTAGFEVLVRGRRGVAERWGELRPTEAPRSTEGQSHG